MMEQNERLLRARQETHEDMVYHVGDAPYKRAKIVAAVIEGVESKFVERISYPFFGTPNYTRSRELKLLARIPKTDRLALLIRALETELRNGTTKYEDVPLLQLISKSDRESLIRLMTETQKAEMLEVGMQESESNAQVQKRRGKEKVIQEELWRQKNKW